MLHGFLWKKKSSDTGSNKPNAFHQSLESQVGKRLKLRINDNRTTMLSVKWEPDATKVSMHRMFLKAPPQVLDELAVYLRRKPKQMSPILKTFIEEGWQNLDYTHLLDQATLPSEGKVYNLLEIYNEVNQEYFDGEYKLFISWYGQHNKKYRSQVTFGLFYDSLKLIKINRLLDNERIPKYVVAFTVYHEMLHHVCPTKMKENGTRDIHNREFKQKEREFREYRQAKQWIKEHFNKFFI